jgi:hypothetical protein
MTIFGRYIGAGKGATAYELQIDRFGVRYTHLTGGAYFGPFIFFHPLRRLSFQWFTLEQAGRE